MQNFVLCKTLYLCKILFCAKLCNCKTVEKLERLEEPSLRGKCNLFLPRFNSALSTLIYNLHLSCTLHCALSTLLNTVQLFNCSILFNFTGFHWTQLRAGFSVLAPAFSEQNAPGGQFKCTLCSSPSLYTFLSAMPSFSGSSPGFPSSCKKKPCTHCDLHQVFFLCFTTCVKMEGTFS